MTQAEELEDWLGTARLNNTGKLVKTMFGRGEKPPIFHFPLATL
jgi:hypothetical protein